ncbi:hypothetical protein C8Q79DRAFT_682979 [Trametes meyenii]|nr:hypothetical protein C8Q79DRAFT_682979 [Trametes meyenii]
MSFPIGCLRPHDASEIKHIRHSQETAGLRTGDIVEFLGHVCEWDKDCITTEICEGWRKLSDPLCDNALREAFPSPSASVGKDLLQKIEELASKIGPYEIIRQFMEEVQQPPPAGIRASEEDIVLAQTFFLDNSIQIMQALLHYSLAGGFASSQIVRTLEAVSYLVPHVRRNNSDTSHPPSISEIVSSISKASSDRTLTRLLETFQFVLDVMGCASPVSSSNITKVELNEPSTQDRDVAAYLLPGGEAWKSTIRVRLLHGVARWRVEERWKKDPNARTETPISQTDLAATLAAFSTVPIWCLRRLNLPPSYEQTSAYLALWRHVGYYLGVSPRILLRYFGNPQTADKFLATAALHLFSDDPSDPSPTAGAPRPHSAIARGPTLPILVAVSNRPPMNSSLEYNIALTTHLLGRPLAQHLGLPPTPLAARLRMYAFLLAQRIPHAFARWYPRRAWLEKRRAVMREGLMRTVRGNLGLRRTAFRPRTDIGEDEETGGGEIAPGVLEEERIETDPERTKMLRKMWSEVWKEMVAVCVAVGVVAITLSLIGLRSAVRYVRV